MPSTEAQLSIPNTSFIQKLLEQAAFNTASTATIATNSNDSLMSSFSNPYSTFVGSNPINNISSNTNVSPLSIFDQTNNSASNNFSFDAFMYYNGNF